MIKSLDYLEELMKMYDKDELLEILERLEWMLRDNDEWSGSSFISELMGIVDKED